MAKIPKKGKEAQVKDLTGKPVKRKRKRVVHFVSKKIDNYKPSKPKQTKVTTTRKRKVTRVTKTAKLRKNLQATIRRMEKAGYRVPTSIKEDVKTVTIAKLKQYQRNQYATLYKASTALYEGKILTGTEYRTIKRKESARKAAETRQRKKLLKDIVTTPSKEDLYPTEEIYENEPDFEDIQRAHDAEFQKRKEDAAFREDVSIGTITYETIMDIIHKYENLGAGRFGEYFRKMIEYYEGKYNINDIMRAIAVVGTEEFYERAYDILYYAADQSALADSVTALRTLIEKAMMYAGMTPDFQWNDDINTVIEQETSDYTREENYPY